MSPPGLLESWADLLQRRPTLRAALTVYDPVVAAWASWSPPRPLSPSLDAATCRARWESGTPLVDVARQLRADDVEALLGSVMDVLARAVPRLAAGLQRFAEAWDSGRLDPGALLSASHHPSGAAGPLVDLDPPVVALLATLGLRPALDTLYAPLREHLADGMWAQGNCPFCGGPPGFTDVVEDGRRRVSCLRCGGAWLFAKLRCPFCGVDGARHMARLTPEDPREEGYVIAACRECRAYVKELDRRTRWNGGPPILEDWGSPHFDLIAQRERYWRPDASVVLLAGAA